MRLAAHRRGGPVVVGAGLVAGYVGYHRWQVRWGATGQEVAEPSTRAGPSCWSSRTAMWR